MRKKYMFGYYKMPMNLQFFAEGGDGGDGAGAEGGNGAGSGEGTGGAGSDKPMTFDDFLAAEGNQAEFDRRVNKAVSTAVTKAQEKWKALTDDKLSEADKLAKMNKEEKAEYMRTKKEKELADREAAITRKELMAEAKDTLADEGLPIELAETLNYTDAEACKQSIETVKAAFQKAVEAAVEKRLKGGNPQKKAPENNQVTKEQYAKMTYAEKVKLKSENPELYRQLAGV